MQKSFSATMLSQQQKVQTCPSRQTYSSLLCHTVSHSPWLIHTQHNEHSIPGYHRGIARLPFPHTPSYPMRSPSQHLDHSISISSTFSSKSLPQPSFSLKADFSHESRSSSGINNCSHAFSAPPPRTYNPIQIFRISIRTYSPKLSSQISSASQSELHLFLQKAGSHLSISLTGISVTPSTGHKHAKIGSKKESLSSIKTTLSTLAHPEKQNGPSI